MSSALLRAKLAGVNPGTTSPSVLAQCFEALWFSSNHVDQEVQNGIDWFSGYAVQKQASLTHTLHFRALGWESTHKEEATLRERPAEGQNKIEYFRIF